MTWNKIRNWFTEERWGLLILCGFAVMFIIWLPIVMVGGVPSVVTAEARDGYVDLSGTARRGGKTIYRLEGQWEYYPRQLLTPADFEANETNAVSYASFPHTWRSDPRFAGTSGYATYRLVGQKDSLADSIGIYSRFQFGAYKIYVDGVNVLEIGHVSENPEAYYVSYQSGNAYVCPVEDDTFEIILQIQNYDHVMAGFSGSIFFGDMDSIKLFTEFLLILNGIMIGFLLVLLVYFVTVYLQDRKKSLYLYIAIVTLMSLYVTMTTCNEAITYSVVPLVSPHIIFKLEYITQIIAALFSTQYILKKYMTSKIYRNIMTGACFVVVAVIALVPSVTVSRIRMPFQVLAASYYFVPLFLTFRAIIKSKSKSALWECISLLTLISGIVFTKLGVMLWNCVDIFPILMTLYCFIQVVVLLYYYAGVEQNLSSLNQTLESRIEARTRELVMLKQKAEAATTAKSDFLALMSHEIRTPMNAIIGMSDLIQTDNLDDTQKLYFRDIKTVSHSLLNIVNDILDFSKIESGKFQIVPVHFNFYSMLDNICSLFFYSAKSKDLRFESNVDVTLPPVLYGDETRIRQTLSNILSNAVKYTHKGSITFTVERANDDRDILFTVTDTGVGIKEENIPRLFMLFEQLDKSDSLKGTGLGLAICKQLAELMGGYVSVTSEYGVGSTFVVCLPLVEGDPDLIEAELIQEKVYADKAKVLVVDDNSINITVAKGVLATHDIKPDSATSGPEAIAMAREKDYDIIFMDHMMPEMDGIETAAAIRALGEQYRELPIIALTANAVSGTREFLMASGMTDFISKPIDRVALNQILAKWLPFDKIEMRAQAENEPPPLQGPLLLLVDIPGLNIQNGLFHVGGNADTYLTVINQFIYETPAYLGQLADTADKGNIDLYAVIVHGLKGSLNAIGAQWLGDWAFSLEKSAKSGDLKTCRSQTEKFIGSVNTLIGALKLSLTEQEAEEDIKSQASTDQLFEMLAPLKTACILGDCTTADDITAALKHLRFGEPYDAAVTEIIGLVEHLDYEKTVEILDELWQPTD